MIDTNFPPCETVEDDEDEADRPCIECSLKNHDDCEDPLETRRTPETGAWCWVKVCCCELRVS